MANNWFPHDSSAQNDQKILLLRMKYGWEGYGLFWATLEAMYETVDGKLDAKTLHALCVRFGVKEDYYKSFISYCEEIGLLTEDENVLFSLRLVKEKERHISRSEQAKSLAELRWNKGKRKPRDAKALPRHSQGNAKGNAPTNPPTTPTNQAGAEKNDDDETTNGQQKLVERKQLTDDEILEYFYPLMVEFHDQSYADKTMSQFRLLRGDRREEVLRKMRVMINSAKHPVTTHFAKKVSNEIAGCVNDFGEMERKLNSQEVAKRRKFAEEESGKQYVEQEINSTPF